MMQEATTMPVNGGQRVMLSSQSLVTLLALVGAKRMTVETLRGRIGLNSRGFGNLLGWLQREYLVDVISRLDGDRVVEYIELTERGEVVLVNMLENTCELPELH